MTPAKTSSSKQFGFFKRIAKSFKGPEAYEAQKKRTFWAVVGDMLAVTLIAMGLGFVALAFAFHAFWPQVETKIVNVNEWYPDDLSLTVQNGVATSSNTEPYILDLAELFAEEGHPAEGTFNLIVDTQTPFSVTEFQEYGPGIWVSKDAIVTHTPDGKFEQYPWTQTGDFTLNSEIVKAGATTLSDGIEKLVYLALLIVWLAASLGATIWRLFYLLIFALVVQFIAYVMGAKYPEYIEAYKMGGLAFIPAIVITTLTQATAFWTGFSGFVFYFSLISALFIAINLKREKA